MANECKILDYDRGHILGQGGYETVFKEKLVQRSSDIQVINVAIKRLEKAMLNQQDDETISMIYRELVIQKKLDHPIIVKFLHVEKHDENFL